MRRDTWAKAGTRLTTAVANGVACVGLTPNSVRLARE